jgi:hypothetical protein
MLACGTYRAGSFYPRMSKAEECRAKALLCEQMARDARDLTIKVELEQLAVEWRKLAKEIEENDR